ncbi:MAG: small subunit ribosomal protein [Planctomycetota bacterium]|nr:MAG: small subunit ribosomal protein [Planctomycetota bacterium]
MAHSRSAKKRVRQSDKRRIVNRALKARFRSQMKKVLVLAKAKGDGVQKEYRELVSWLDKAAAKHVIHKNAASRYKSRVAAKIKSLAAAAK